MRFGTVAMMMLLGSVSGLAGCAVLEQLSTTHTPGYIEAGNRAHEERWREEYGGGEGASDYGGSDSGYGGYGGE